MQTSQYEMMWHTCLSDTNTAPTNRDLQRRCNLTSQAVMSQNWSESCPRECEWSTASISNWWFRGRGNIRPRWKLIAGSVSPWWQACLILPQQASCRRGCVGTMYKQEPSNILGIRKLVKLKISRKGFKCQVLQFNRHVNFSTPEVGDKARQSLNLSTKKASS